MRPICRACEIIMPSESPQEKDGLYLSIIQVARECIQAMDDQLRATYVDPQLAKMFGFDPDLLLNESLSGFMLTENLSEIIVK